MLVKFIVISWIFNYNIYYKIIRVMWKFIKRNILNPIYNIKKKNICIYVHNKKKFCLNFKENMTKWKRTFKKSVYIIYFWEFLITGTWKKYVCLNFKINMIKWKRTFKKNVYIIYFWEFLITGTWNAKAIYTFITFIQNFLKYIFLHWIFIHFW